MPPERQPLVGTGVALRDPLPWNELLSAVAEAEAAGYAAAFVPEISGREAFATLAGFAGATSSLRLGTGVVPIDVRRPLVVAMAAATVQELSGGRHVLGLGTGGIRAGALDRLRESVATIRGLLAGAEHEGVRLALRPEPPPIWVAALGPRAMRVAGEVADGVLLNLCPPERVAFAAERIRAAARAAGRDPEQVTVAVYVRAAVGVDEAAALPPLRAMAAAYASFPAYRRQFEAVGLGREAEAAAAAYGAGRIEDVPEGFVRALALVGDPEAARVRLDAYREAGAHLPIVYPVGSDADAAGTIRATIAALARGG